MELLMPLKALVVAHPIECATLMLLLLSALNGVLKGPPDSLLGVLIDRLSFLVRSDAKGTLSWPVIGRSLFDAAVDQAKREEPKR